MYCVVVIIALVCIACLLFGIFIRNRYKSKMRGGYAYIDNTGIGTVIRFPNDPNGLHVIHSPIVIRLAEGNHLDVQKLYNNIKPYNNLIQIIKDAVKKPCGILGNPEIANKSIYSALSKYGLHKHELFKRDDGVCNMDGILRKLSLNDDGMNVLSTIRDTLISVMKTNNNNYYIVDAMLEVSQGDSFGNAYGDNHRKYLYMYGENLNHDPQMHRYNTLIDDYILASEITIDKNGKKRTISFDIFSKEIFNNDDVRNWYGSSKTAYKIMNTQYIRPGDNKKENPDENYIRQSLKKVAPDGALTKNPADNIADIIPAGSVRQSIMLYLYHVLSPLSENSPKLIIDHVYEKYKDKYNDKYSIISAHISYIVLLCGLANAFGNTTHYSDYNAGIGDKYRYTPR